MDEIYSESAVASGLDTRIIGKNLLYFPVINSTMDAAREMALTGAEEGAVVFADIQTAGRGRLKRTWLSPGGNIALSIILHPPIKALPKLVMLASLSVARAIKAVTGLEPLIKWPNDVLIDGKKVCGILIENEMRGGSLSYAIVGIGVNVNLSPERYEDISSTATSLSKELGGEISRTKLLRSILTEFDSLYLSVSGGDALFQEWRSSLVTLGKNVSVTFLGGDSFDGNAEDVDADGNLLVRKTDGSLVRVVAGDVTLRQ